MFNCQRFFGGNRCCNPRISLEQPLQRPMSRNETPEHTTATMQAILVGPGGSAGLGTMTCKARWGIGFSGMCQTLIDIGAIARRATTSANEPSPERCHSDRYHFREYWHPKNGGKLRASEVDVSAVGRGRVVAIVGAILTRSPRQFVQFGTSCNKAIRRFTSLPKHNRNLGAYACSQNRKPRLTTRKLRLVCEGVVQRSVSKFPPDPMAARVV